MSAARLRHPQGEGGAALGVLADKQIDVVDQDYLTAGGDAVVNSTNDMLAIGSNVSQRIALAAGEALEAALQAILCSSPRVPLPLGSAVATGSFGLGGETGTRFIVHAVGVGCRRHAGSGGRLLATPKTVFDAVSASVRVADALKCRTLVFPVMFSRPGYSVLRCDASTVRWVMGASVVLGIRATLPAAEWLERATISVFSGDRYLEECDRAMFQCLVREPGKIDSVVGVGSW